MIDSSRMAPEGEKPLTEDEFRHFGEALMGVGKDELAEVIAAEERDRAKNHGEPRRGRPRKRLD